MQALSGYKTAATHYRTYRDGIGKGQRLEVAMDKTDGEFGGIDEPAVIYKDGTKVWYEDNKRHRDNGPAFIGADGKKEWWQNDKLHREDGPAVTHPDGMQEWYLNGKKYPVVEWNKTTKHYTCEEEVILKFRFG